MEVHLDAACPRRSIPASFAGLFAMSLKNIVVAGFLLVAVSACSSKPGRLPDPSASTVSAPMRKDPNVISKAELADASIQAMTVYDAIRTLRPKFLNERGSSSSESDPESGKVHASLDANGIVPVAALREIHASAVIEIRLLNIAAAMQKFGGAAHEGPVILVRTF